MNRDKIQAAIRSAYSYLDELRDAVAREDQRMPAPCEGAAQAVVLGLIDDWSISDDDAEKYAVLYFERAGT